VSDLRLTKYLIKPFFNEDLFGALNQALEEMQNFRVVSNKIIQLKDSFVWNLTTQMLYDDHNQVIKLTPKERKILGILFTNINNTITYDALLVEVWNDIENNHLDTLKTMMKNIRKKLPKNTIQNIYATGFKINI